MFIGSVTDPYQPIEEKYCRTRALLEELQGSGAKLSIATKSDLILRDLDIIKTFPDARVSWSVNTLDETFKEDMDKAVSIERRLAAMKAFHKAGVRTTCFISPIFPVITDVKAITTQAKEHCNLIWLENLNLRGNYKAVINPAFANDGLFDCYTTRLSKGKAYAYCYAVRQQNGITLFRYTPFRAVLVDTI